MPKPFFTYDTLVTADGSPTISLARADGYAEKMHHSGGALTESLFIYGEALERARERGSKLRVLSLGLGLAYNELITIAAVEGELEKLWSFEANSDLREHFLAWVGGNDQPVLDDVCERVATHFRLSRAELHRRTREALAAGTLELRTSFPEAAEDLKNINLVYYDAFSNKMDASLWGAHGLVRFFGPRLGTEAVFATYAATGELNRALKALDFRREKKSGFMKRRQSTLALRPAQISAGPSSIDAP